MPLSPHNISRTSILLVLDMQEGFLKAMPERKAAESRCALAIEAATLLGMQTLFTEQMPDKLGPTLPALLDLAERPQVFAKSAFSGLGAPGLDAYLAERGVQSILLAGLETPVCVYQTAMAAAEQRLDLTLLSDAVTCRRGEDGTVALQAIREAGCRILPVETVFYHLLADAAHPKFRDFTELVKTYG